MITGLTPYELRLIAKWQDGTATEEERKVTVKFARVMASHMRVTVAKVEEAIDLLAAQGAVDKVAALREALDAYKETMKVLADLQEGGEDERDEAADRQGA